MGITEFLEGLKADTYPETPTGGHDQITLQALEWVLPHVTGRQVLDVGCGQGVALVEFQRRGFNAIGTGVNQTDLDECRAKGLAVAEADMHYNGAETTFDLIWMRHVLEHSPIPLYVLRLMAARLNPGGVIYVEVPAPGTSARHETNPNHYAVHTDMAWAELFRKAGLEIVEAHDITMDLPCGPDIYYAFIIKKP